ncbi:MAG: Glycerophosphodiester phosphodiesterase [Anaerolineales bacterium]|nr:Glycerophosphodiester phosphodiesterase [Anaerolineales bacterium]
MKKWIFRILLVVVALVILGMLVMPKAPQAAYYQNAPRPMVIAHQGGDGLWPSNTLFAFEHAAALGVDVLEMDIHMTKDGVLVVSHDDTVDRLTDGEGFIKEMSLAQVQGFDAAYDWSPLDNGAEYPYRGQGIIIPTLESVFERFPDYRMNIEIKQEEPSIAKPFCALLRKHHMENKILVASFKDEALAEFRETCPEVATSGSRGQIKPFIYMHLAFLGRLYPPNFSAVQLPIEDSGITLLTRRFVQVAHARGLWVDAWTIDDPAEMRMLVGLGVDGIITDRPDLLMEALGR